MPVTLQGGCRVSEMREGPCSTLGTLSVWQQIGRAVSAKAISLRTLEFHPGRSPALRNEESDEVLYFLESLGSNLSDQSQKVAITIDSQSFEVEPQSGIYLRPGQTMTVDNPGPNEIVFVSCQCPEPQSTASTAGERIKDASTNIGGPPAIVKLSDRATIPTGDRWYRVLVDDEVGSAQVTQFVGSIPPGRAPDHFHNYEEVLFILRGKGRMWAGDTNTPIEPGSCVYLPKGQIHCVENTGNDELRLLGVFYPAGSPSVRYEV